MVLGAYALLGRHPGRKGDRPAQPGVNHELTVLGNRILFFTLWWKGLPDERASALAPDPATDADAAFFLLDQRRLSAYALDEHAEQIINTKDTDGIGGVLTVFSMLTNRLTFKIEVEGEQRELTRDELASCFLSPDSDLRERAYRELGRVLQHDSKVLGQIYAHRVRDWYNEQVKLRGYASPIAVRNLSNDVPDARLRSARHGERNAHFHSYFRLKAPVGTGAPAPRRPLRPVR
jgi:oligoendopeptidase F